MNIQDPKPGSSKGTSIDTDAETANDTIEGIIRRAKVATGSKTNEDLANYLGISRNSVSKAKARGKIPDRWITEISRRANVKVLWLLSGSGKFVIEEKHEGLGPDGLKLLEDIIVMVENDFKKRGINISPKKKAVLISNTFDQAYRTNGQINKRAYSLVIAMLAKHE